MDRRQVLVLSPKLSRLVRRGETAMRSLDWETLTAVVAQLRRWRSGRFASADDGVGVLVYTAELQLTLPDFDYDEALSLCNLAIPRLRGREPLLAHTLSLRGEIHSLGYARQHDPRALDAAVDSFAESLALTPHGHPELPQRFGHMLTQLDERYHLRHDPQDLNRAIQLCREYPEVGQDWLPELLARRYEVTGDTASGEEALAYREDTRVGYVPADEAAALAMVEAGLAQARRLAEAMPYGTPRPDEPMRSEAFGTVADATFRLYERLPDRLDLLEDAICAAREAVVSAGRTDGMLIDTQNLAASLRQILPGITEMQAGRPWRHPSYAAHVVNLGVYVFERYRRTGDRTSLAEDEALYRQALGTMVEDSIDEAKIRSNLASVLFERYQLDRDEQALDESLAVMRAAGALTSWPPVVLINLLCHHGHLAARAGRWAEAAEVYARAVAQLPRLAPRHLQLGDRERLLTNYLGLASDAAACAIQAGDPARALTVLEQGRGIIFSHVREGHNDLAELRDVDPGLADRLAAVRLALDDLAAAPAARPAETAADRRHRLGEEWRSLLEQARRLPGLAGFLTPPTLERIQSAAGGAVLVVVNVSQYRCDALVVTPSSEGVALVPLPELRQPDVGERSARFQAAVRTAQNDGDSFAERLTAQAEARGVLTWLWHAVCGPIVEFIDAASDAAGQPPTVRWSSTGALTQLPLHAAGDHLRHGGPNPPTVLDRVVSSYLPTLHPPGARPAGSPGARSMQRSEQRLLTVAMPQTSGHPDLPATVAEVAVPRVLRPRGRTLVGAAADRETILAELRKSSWAHFACHATAEPRNPSSTHLVVADGRLTVSDIFRLRLDDAHFAYLSACGSGLGAQQLADEALTIGATFHLAGFAGVVATLWPLPDNVAVHAATAFYRHVDASGMPGPAALRAAIRELRDEQPMAPSSWAGLIYIG